MSYGLQTFRADGVKSFDSDVGALRIFANKRVTGSTSFTVDRDPPYTFVVHSEDNYESGWAQQVQPAEVRVTSSGRTVTVQYVNINNQYGSINMPATIWVLG